jgi:hypothetical protein
MTHIHKLTRGLRSLGKAETAETETARYPRAQKIQQFNQRQTRVTLHDADAVPLPEPAHLLWSAHCVGKSPRPLDPPLET